MPYFNLDHLYKFLSPDFSSGNNPANSSTVVAKPFYNKVAELLIDSRGISYSWATIKSAIESYATNVEANDLADTKANFRFLGPGDAGSLEKLSDETYFSGVTSTRSVNPDLKDEYNKVTVIAIRDPRVTISTAACDKVGRFLNYTPSIVASQMIPYLDVEFRLIGNSEFTRAPSTLRFLLGVVKNNTLNKNDRVMFEGSMNRLDNSKELDWANRDYMKSGMELFLMPQSLTNMDSLGSESSGAKIRTAPAKPFLPLASIEAFDITLRNAGAKNFQHQTGNLKLKVHDKARLSEMAEFIRGGDGFRQVEIITRYGWAAPELSKEENEFIYFINKEMVKEDVWAIVNTQMSFDSTGQANIGIQLVNAGGRNLGRTNIVEVENPTIKTFNETVAKIAGYVDKIQSSNKFPTTTTIATILKDASSKGFYTTKDSNKIKNEIEEYDKLLAKQGVLKDSERAGFKEALLALNKTPAANRKVAGKSLYEKAQEDARNEIKKKFENIKKNNKIDPWLPKRGGLFNPKLVAEVDKKKSTGVASFAKVMLYFGTHLATKDVSEVQFVFYPVNAGAGYAGYAGTGPNRSISLAEFPIDIDLLEKVCFTRIKELNTTSLNIEEFMRLLVEENFSDARSIAYGKSSFYTAFVEGKKEPAKISKGGESGLKEWEKENPEFVQCQIALDVTVESPVGNPDYKIKKIHIYDKETKIFNDFSSMTIEQKKEELQNGVPLITIGTNGSLILNSAVASKTDGTQQAVYLAQAMKANPDTGTLDPTKNPVAEPDNNLPLRTLPVQLTMTSLGCPIAKLYQKYFVDFFTGTSIDNLYMCTQIQHTLGPGKFTTSWTFMQDTGGYSRFIKPTPPAVAAPPASAATSGPSKANAKAGNPTTKSKKTPAPKGTVTAQTTPASAAAGGVPFEAPVPAVPAVRSATSPAPLPSGGRKTGEF